MSEMVERVAVALAKTNGGDFYDPNFYTEEQRDVWRAKARAAIEAMRVPTEEMISTTYLLDIGERGSPISRDDKVSVWQAIIDAALK